ncbi:hypothetical protein [Sphingomonas sp. Leaf17]|uniref:hypothetical protein n=1 Tax=Sphingomonas sp. Leaf17 TaxID=1735683 RepID=UPI001F220F2F|nr:hypothetical protein [Sphingomonas sp. Leaf17]
MGLIATGNGTCARVLHFPDDYQRHRECHAMKKIAVSALILASAVSLSACSTLRGAAIGGAGGAGVAAATGGSIEKGAAVGGTAGAVVGTVAD